MRQTKQKSIQSLLFSFQRKIESPSLNFANSLRGEQLSYAAKTFRGFGSFNGLVMGITHTSLKADTDVNEYNQR